MASSSLMKTLFFVLIMFFAGLQVSMGGVYKVGDSDGWSIGSVDYSNWASSKTFHPGDTLVFEYNAQFYNVMQVSPRDYKSCNASAVPLAIYGSGNDAVALKRAGNYFFVCGAPGHCDAGQKVEIKVVPSSSSSPTALSPVAPPTTSASVASTPLLAKMSLAFALFLALLAY